MFELIVKLMESKGISQMDLSKNTSVSQQQFCNWKYGKSKPSTRTLQELAEYFDVPISYFFGQGLVEKYDNFSNEDILLARELNKTKCMDLIKDIIKIQSDANIEALKVVTKNFLKSEGK